MTNEREWWLVADFDNPKVERVAAENPGYLSVEGGWYWPGRGHFLGGINLFPTRKAAYDAVEVHICSRLAALQEQLREIAHERMRT